MDEENIVPVFLAKMSPTVTNTQGKQVNIPLNSLWTFKEKRYVEDVDSRVFEHYPDKEQEVSLPRLMVPFIMKQIF